MRGFYSASNSARIRRWAREDDSFVELNQLRYFCAVARTGSFTKAAEQEGIAQPSLSQQIRKLDPVCDGPARNVYVRSFVLPPC